jgi:hypothetical protein
MLLLACIHKSKTNYYRIATKIVLPNIFQDYFSEAGSTREAEANPAKLTYIQYSCSVKKAA